MDACGGLSISVRVHLRWRQSVRSLTHAQLDFGGGEVRFGWTGSRDVYCGHESVSHKEYLLSKKS